VLHELAHTLAAFVARNGYWAVALIIGIESMGIPLPGETVLVATAVFAGQTHRLSIVLVIVSAVVGAVLGDNAGFAIGREGGFRLLLRHGPKIGITERRLKLGVWLFRKYGGAVVFFGRFIALLRTWAAFLAGTNRMTWGRFLVWNAIGGIVWATAFGLAGFYLGRRVHELAGTIGKIMLLAALVLIVILTRFVRRHAKALEDRAEREMPGPIEDVVHAHVTLHRSSRV
jgi:membrane protein DedA with SNARE-associated domain